MSHYKFSNLIIPQWDPRFGSVGKLFKKFDFNKIYSNEGLLSKYLIPKELVLVEIDRWSGRGNHILVSKSKDNLVSNRRFSNILFESTHLTPQEYYDLLVLHINNIEDRPKCVNCRCKLSISRLHLGYSSHKDYDDYHTFCSISCSKQYYMNNVSEDTVKSNLFIELNKNYKFRVKSEMNKFKSMGNESDLCSLYLEVTESGKLKFGVTADDLEDRLYHSMISDQYTEITELFCDTRNRVANLEALIKLEFNGREYLELSEKDTLLRLLNNYIKSDLDKDPIIIL